MGRRCINCWLIPPRRRCSVAWRCWNKILALIMAAVPPWVKGEQDPACWSQTVAGSCLVPDPLPPCSGRMGRTGSATVRRLPYPAALFPLPPGSIFWSVESEPSGSRRWDSPSEGNIFENVFSKCHFAKRSLRKAHKSRVVCPCLEPSQRSSKPKKKGLDHRTYAATDGVLDALREDKPSDNTHTRTCHSRL